MNVSIVIPTRGTERSQFVEHLTGHLLPRQTRQPDEVILIDYEPTKQNDQLDRLKEGYEKSTGDLTLIMEDDDWYHCDYIKHTAAAWELFGRPKLIGCSRTMYYHIKARRYKTMNHDHRSSLFTTGISGEIDWDSLGKRIDMGLWTKYTGKLTSYVYLAIGIKHGIGVCGGAGHDPAFMTESDEDGSLLRELVDKESFDFYNSI